PSDGEGQGERCRRRRPQFPSPPPSGIRLARSAAVPAAAASALRTAAKVRGPLVQSRVLRLGQPRSARQIPPSDGEGAGREVQARPSPFPLPPPSDGEGAGGRGVSDALPTPVGLSHRMGEGSGACPAIATPRRRMRASVGITIFPRWSVFYAATTGDLSLRI